MMAHRTLSNLEISQTADELVIRGRKLAVVASVISVVLLVPFSSALIYQGIFGNAQFSPIWDRPPGDRIVGVLIMLIGELPFGVGSIAACFMYLRNRRRPWVFDRKRSKLTKHNQSWSLEDLTDVAVDVRRFGRTGSAGVVLCFRNVDPLEIERFHTGGGKGSRSLNNRIAVASSVAGTIGEFLQVPVRQPPASGRRFEVVMPVRS